MKKLMLLILLSTTTAQAQQMNLLRSEAPPHVVYLRTTQDRWIADDKVAHFAIGYLSADILMRLTDAQDSDSRRLAIFGGETAFWFVWETKDALLPWETFGAIGGDGFSWKDLVVSLAGAGLRLVLHP